MRCTDITRFNVLSDDILGQKISSLALRRHELVPECPSWTLTFSSFRMAVGMTTRSPLRTMPACTVSSPLSVRRDAERDFAFLAGPSFSDGVYELR